MLSENKSFNSNGMQWQWIVYSSPVHPIKISESSARTPVTKNIIQTGAGLLWFCGIRRKVAFAFFGGRGLNWRPRWSQITVWDVGISVILLEFTWETFRHCVKWRADQNGFEEYPFLHFSKYAPKLNYLCGRKKNFSKFSITKLCPW